jgi:TolB-like protein
MSFLAELKRRNVLRVAVGYAVASWLLLQITDVLSSVLGLPPLAGRFVFLLLVIGLVPVLAFAWSYQVTPEGLKRDRGTGGGSVETARNLDRATIAMLIAVTAMVLVDRYLPREESVQEAHEDIFAESAVPETSAASRSDETHDDNTVSLAILPFTNMSPDPENEYFSDGVSEELISLLMRVDGLRVPSRTSSFAWKGQSRDIREIARELQVGHILEGSVRKAGNRVRITAQLIDTTTDTHLWSQTWDRDLEDIFAIQEDIAGHIVDSLQVVLDREAIQLRPTENLAAYSLYLEGRQLFQRRGDGLAEAVRLLREAVRLDPDFAEAWATLSLAYGFGQSDHRCPQGS